MQVRVHSASLLVDRHVNQSESVIIMEKALTVGEGEGWGALDGGCPGQRCIGESPRKRLSVNGGIVQLRKPQVPQFRNHTRPLRKKYTPSVWPPMFAVLVFLTGALHILSSI